MTAYGTIIVLVISRVNVIDIKIIVLPFLRIKPMLLSLAQHAPPGISLQSLVKNEMILTDVNS
jgi:hypothetical protein